VADRINAGTLLAALGAILLLVSLFLDWWEPGLSAWTAFEVVDLLLAVIAALVLLAAAGELARRRFGVEAERLLLPAGIAALLLVIVSIVNNPPAAQGLDEDVGAWIGLAGAILIGLGAFLAQRRVSIVISSSPRDRERRADAAPATESRGPTGPATEPPGSEEATRTDNPVDRR
jgi:hypothetical protein